MNNVVIFGAGNYGEQAFKRYGDELVEFFVDNASNKIGGNYCGKPVYSFEQTKMALKERKIVIAVKNYLPIIEQLEAEGLTNYHVYSRETERLINDYLSKNEYKQIAIYGIDTQSQDLITKVLKSGFGKSVKYIVGEDDNEQIGNVIYGFKICRLSEIVSDIDALIIARKNNHSALRLRLTKEYGARFVIIDPFKPRTLYETDEIVLNKYISKEAFNEDTWNELNAQNIVIKHIDNFVDTISPILPLFEFVEIETINRCNGTCSFCPVNKKIDQRPLKTMSHELYKSIVDQLSALRYSGAFALYSNNEPLLDKHIIERAKYAKECLPHANIFMFTNGTLFTMEKFISIIPYLDELIINNYSLNLELIKPCLDIKEYVGLHPELRRKVTIELRRPDEILSSRGGDSPNRKKILSFENAKCELPFRQMVIRPDGKVSLCCNDPLGTYTLGDLTNKSILDVWYGEEYKKIREAISRGRKNIKKCEKCDVFLMQQL